MQSILNFFKSRYFWIGFGFVLLITLALVVGYWLEWSLVTQLSIVIGLLVIGMGIIIYELVKANRSAEQIEQSIKMQAEQQRKNSRPDKQAEIEELQERLEDAIAKLKKSKLGRGRRGNAALHALPWYMFIGPPGAGKTTAIQNSGLNFPIGTDGVQGVGGTRNCDWFFTDQAILLDTAGRYMTEREDKEEWHAFLEMLKEHRTGRPINGVLVGISIEKLMDVDPSEVEWHANNIRRRISELVEKLGVRFPVYLVFTKCDLLQGFVEFFRDLTRKERQQIWGCTLSKEQREESSPRALFEEEFDLLYDALIDKRAGRLSRSMKREERRKVYTFPLQFASAKENLSFFIDQLFQENPYQENPEFRGFYFTSGTQEGAPIDHVIHSVSEEFEFASGIEEGTEPQTEAKSYFLRDLFTEAVIPDQYLVEQTSSAARRSRLVRWGLGAAAAVLLGLGVAGLSQALVRSQLTLENTEEVARAAAAVEWDDANVAADLKRMGALKDQIERLQANTEDPPLLQAGLSRSGTVLAPTRTLYYQKMRPLMRSQFEVLEQRLATAESATKEERSLLRDQLENYLLLADSSHALSQARYQDQLSEYLIGQLTQPPAAARTASFEGYGGQLEEHVAAYIEGLQKGYVQPFQAQSVLVERVTRQVNRPPTIGRIYARIREKGNSQFEPITLASLLRDGKGTALFKRPTALKVSGFFTKRAWNNFVETQIEQAAKSPQQEGLIGESSGKLSEDLRNPQLVRKKLRQRYFSQYATAWQRFLGNVEYRSFNSLRSTAQNLQILGDKFNSPLLYVLAGVTNQTRFESMLSKAKKAGGAQAKKEAARRAEGALQRQTGVRANASGAISSSKKPKPHPVNRRMRSIHRLKADRTVSGEASSNLKQALGVLRKVGRKLDGIRNDRRQMYTFAQRTLDENGGLLGQQMTSIRDYMSQVPAQIRRDLFEQPILAAWSGILAETQSYLNERWNQEVYSFYRANLQGRYPLSDSPTDIPLRTFRNFFRPEKGKLASFYQNRLAPFLREGTRRPKKWEGQGIEVSSALRQSLARADEIREALFRGGFTLQFSLTPRQPIGRGNAPPPEQIRIRAHGTEQVYRMGVSTEKQFQWPGNGRDALLELTTAKGRLDPLQFDGPWAWFRLLEAATIDRKGPTNYRLQWRVAPPSDRYSFTVVYDLYNERASRVFAAPSEVLRFRVPETIN